MLLNDRFRVISVIASGGMGRIYRAEQLPLGRAVAIKALHTKYTSSNEDPAFQRRFFLEASILSKLQHPNIVTVFDYGRIQNVEDEAYFMAMEYLPGETLHRRLRALGALSPPEAIHICRQIARGLREAHRNGVVHRDLKPSNVMLVPENDGTENVKILDFGLVKLLTDESEELTKEGSFLGSPRYMSPEQIAHGKVDHRTDIYSLGVILYQCLCGRAPFENENSVHTLMAHLQLPVPPMRERNPAMDVPEVLEALVMRCMEKQADARPADMDDFLRGLHECEVTLGLAAPGAPVTGQFLPGAKPSSVPPPLPESHTGPIPRVGSGPLVTGSHLTPSVSQAGTLMQVPPGAVMPATPTVSMPAESSKSNKVLIAAVLTLAVLASAVSIAALVGRRDPPPPATTQAPPSAGLREYRLVIDSQPPGAQVFEGDALLGATPLTITIDNQVARENPRQLQVRKDGYEPFVIPAGPSSEATVRTAANLIPRAAQVVAPPPTTPPPNAPSTVNTAPRVQTGTLDPTRPPRPPRNNTPSDNDDIRSHR
jgi:serine/threonine-protein kinase